MGKISRGEGGGRFTIVTKTKFREIKRFANMEKAFPFQPYEVRNVRLRPTGCLYYGDIRRFRSRTSFVHLQRTRQT
jgi:hypothetical protein